MEPRTAVANRNPWSGMDCGSSANLQGSASAETKNDPSIHEASEWRLCSLERMTERITRFRPLPMNRVWLVSNSSICRDEYDPPATKQVTRLATLKP
jgi:hypothetical protein